MKAREDKRSPDEAWLVIEWLANYLFVEATL